MSTRRYLISKILQALLTLVFVLAFNFFLFRGLGNPVELQSRGRGALTAEAIKEENHVLGLDLPLPQQFVHYMRETVTGHLGFTLGGDTVAEDIGVRIWPTVLLIGTSTIASILLGVYIGIVQGWRRGSKFDKSMLGVTLVLYAMPEFWFGLLMIMLFSVTLNIFPSGGMQTAATDLHGLTLWLDIGKHLALPFFVLTVSYLAEYSIIMRSSLMEVLTEDFVATARAKGVREKLVRRRHAVPNALLPTMTITILSLGYVLGGAIVIETIFSWPGLGNLTYGGIQARDNSLLQGLFLLFSAAVIVSNLVADLLYSYLDPRVRAA
ncbi:MAG: peptide/nickel transport system permease protein [Actinomycetota bacterium]|nr:peptide/nickel transport system permease protein [Actinomycetota bacterium]MEA2581302.1 peptide/nickel transport system permease protein [Actinomycetota bacterium]